MVEGQGNIQECYLEEVRVGGKRAEAPDEAIIAALRSVGEVGNERWEGTTRRRRSQVGWWWW